MKKKIKYNVNEDLQVWFGLSYATFAVLPRVLMEHMPEKWQKKMTKLLNELNEAYPNMPNIGFRVQATSKGKFIKIPYWLLNYRHPNYNELDKIRRRK